MPISSEQEQIIRNKLSNHIANTTCQFCNGSQWTINNELVGAPGYDSEHKMIIEGAVVPMVLIFCQGCGHFHFFDAMKLGLI